ncbi:ribose 5-phosphate isomerase B [Geomonas sp.]|uniref:ribose 5-phosphate isomerase B n=1 Tax=Geomonas sp. TaxID=2651584 RepID=UPI002B498C10|nr:ribose 5-phosphate isomerase B [Geomonas sp.]HJV36692.1 ribose 5-phosphate isomerase B [Geomonas sp.]
MFVIASDHGGLELKEEIKKLLAERGIQVEDLGTNNGDSVDYPDFGQQVGRRVSEGSAEKGILVCGTGIGMSIVANKFPHVRAALATDVFMATMAKEHNNANILVLGGRVLETPVARQMVAAWLDTEFAGGRHQNRLDKIAALESELKLQ